MTPPLVISSGGNSPPVLPPACREPPPSGQDDPCELPVLLEEEGNPSALQSVLFRRQGDQFVLSNTNPPPVSQWVQQHVADHPLPDLRAYFRGLQTATWGNELREAIQEYFRNLLGSPSTYYRPYYGNPRIYELIPLFLNHSRFEIRENEIRLNFEDVPGFLDEMHLDRDERGALISRLNNFPPLRYRGREIPWNIDRADFNRRSADLAHTTDTWYGLEPFVLALQMHFQEILRNHFDSQIYYRHSRSRGSVYPYLGAQENYPSNHAELVRSLLPLLAAHTRLEVRNENLPRLRFDLRGFARESFVQSHFEELRPLLSEVFRFQSLSYQGMNIEFAYEDLARQVRGLVDPRPDGSSYVEAADILRRNYSAGTRVTWIEEREIENTCQRGGTATYTSRYVATVLPPPNPTEQGQPACGENELRVHLDASSPATSSRCISLAARQLMQITPALESYVRPYTERRANLFSCLNGSIALHSSFLFSPSEEGRVNVANRAVFVLGARFAPLFSWMTFVGLQNNHQVFPDGSSADRWGPAFGGGLALGRQTSSPVSVGFVTSLAPMFGESGSPSFQVDLGLHATFLSVVGIHAGCQWMLGANNFSGCGGGAGVNIPLF